MQQKHAKVVPISIAMPEDMARVLRILAARQNKSRSRFVRELLEEALPPQHHVPKSGNWERAQRPRGHLPPRGLNRRHIAR